MVSETVSWMVNPLKQWRHMRFVRHRLCERMLSIREALRTAPADCVLLVGNSHAEFLGTPDFAGRSCINLGIGGSTAVDCARHLAGLRPNARAASVVLFIGTNDILRWRRPDRQGAADRFTDAVAGILETLEAWTTHVFIAAVPPIGAVAASRDPAAAGTYSERLRTLCARRGHTFFDPFAALRDGATGLALAGLHPDGVHMADYPGLAKEVVRLVDLRLALLKAPTPRTMAASSIFIAGHHPREPHWTFGAIVRAAAHP